DYAAGKVRDYVGVADADVNLDGGARDSLSVSFSSGADSGEVVVLREVGTNTGGFRGQLDLDVLASVMLEGRPVRAWLDEIAAREPDPGVRREQMEAVLRRLGEELRRGKEVKAGGGWVVQMAPDGRLQIRTGETLVVTYHDALNDYGNAQDIRDEAVLGGVRGAVSGLWTRGGSRN